MPTVRPTEAKGVNFRGLLDAVEALGQSDSQQRVIAACSGEMGELLKRGGLTAGAWYPVAWYRDLHAASQRALNRGHDLARECGKWTVRRDLSGIYRVLLFVLTPEAIVSKGSRLMQQYWRGGTVVVPEARDGMVAVDYEGWSGFDRNIWQDLIGGMEGALEAAGAQNVRVRTLSGGGDGDDGLKVEMRWTRG